MFTPATFSPLRNTPIANPYNFAILLSSVFLITNYEDEVIVILQRPQPFHLCEIHQLSTLTTLFTLSKHTPLFSVFSSFPHTCFSLLLFLLSPKYSMHFPLFFHSTSLLFSSFFPRLPHASPFFIPVSVYHICLPFPSSFSPSFSTLTFSSFPHTVSSYLPLFHTCFCLSHLSSLSLLFLSPPFLPHPGFPVLLLIPTFFIPFFPFLSSHSYSDFLSPAFSASTFCCRFIPLLRPFFGLFASPLHQFFHIPSHFPAPVIFILFSTHTFLHACHPLYALGTGEEI